jgi:hypothetical protein
MPLRDIIPFAIPGPLAVVRKVFDLDGVPVELVAERWRLDDLWACRYAEMVEPDPTRPDEGVVTQLRSLATGSSAFALSDPEVEQWARGDRPDPRYRA